MLCSRDQWATRAPTALASGWFSQRRRKPAGGAWARSCRKQAHFAADLATGHIRTYRLAHTPPQRPRKRRYFARTTIRLRENRLTPGAQKRPSKLRPGPRLPGPGGIPRDPRRSALGKPPAARGLLVSKLSNAATPVSTAACLILRKSQPSRGARAPSRCRRTILPGNCRERVAPKTKVTARWGFFSSAPGAKLERAA